jgi:putative transposase
MSYSIRLEQYPMVYLDCIVVKIRQDKPAINKAIYLTLGVNTEGHTELLGMWLSQNEGARFWLGILIELNNRGLENMLIACVDLSVNSKITLNLDCSQKLV